jgi:hypothetical protein
MADGQTEPLELILPEVGGSFGTWGDKLNSNLEDIDDYLVARLEKQAGVAETISAKQVLVEPTAGDATLDLGVARAFHVTLLGATVTFVFANAPGGGVFTGFVVAVENGGLATITWPASVQWHVGEGEPALQDAGVDVLVFLSFDNGTTWLGARAMAVPT